MSAVWVKDIHLNEDPFEIEDVVGIKIDKLKVCIQNTVFERFKAEVKVKFVYSANDVEMKMSPVSIVTSNENESGLGSIDYPYYFECESVVKPSTATGNFAMKQWYIELC